MVNSIQEAYKLLGLTLDSSPDDVKRAYRKMALQCHPDKNPNPTSTAKFQQLSAAYKRIDSHLKRSAVVDSNEPFPTFFHSFDIDDDCDMDAEFWMPSMEELNFMSDMLFGLMREMPRQNRGKREKKKSTSGDREVRVHLRRKKSGRCRQPVVSDQERHNFLDNVISGNVDAELLDLEDEFMAMAGVFKHDSEDFDSIIRSNDIIYEEKISAPKTKPPSSVFFTEKNNKNPPNPRRDQQAVPAIGSRVCIHGKHSGIVKFAGQVHYAKGDFIGVALSSPMGKNDGLIKGVRYFECLPSHGLMLRPTDVTLTA